MLQQQRKFVKVMRVVKMEASWVVALALALLLPNQVLIHHHHHHDHSKERYSKETINKK